MKMFGTERRDIMVRISEVHWYFGDEIKALENCGSNGNYNKNFTKIK